MIHLIPDDIYRREFFILFSAFGQKAKSFMTVTLNCGAK